MRKVISILICFVAAFCFCGCGEDKTQNQGGNGDNTVTDNFPYWQIEGERKTDGQRYDGVAEFPVFNQVSNEGN